MHRHTTSAPPLPPLKPSPGTALTGARLYGPPLPRLPKTAQFRDAPLPRLPLGSPPPSALTASAPD